VIDWKVIAGAWLKDRTQLEVHLTKTFQQNKKKFLFDAF
jgi:hypothetical protein